MTAIARVGVVAKSGLEAAAGVLADLAAWLEARGIEPVLEAETARLARAPSRWRTASRDDLARHVDLVVVLGGDGTLLGMAGRIALAGADIPILGVNYGSLGFLTEIALPELEASLQSVLDGTAALDERLMLGGRVLRGPEVRADRVALNDIVISRGALSRIVDLAIWVGDEFVTRVKGDGLIVASPTGSTAYNLAAGGPIVHYAVDAMVLTPIAPHTLTNRPVVIPASAEVRVQATRENGGEEVVVTFDGQLRVTLDETDVVCIRRAERPLRLVRATARTYFEVLREKLKWGQR
ncbi:MAG TPA: NAD(+)/NADH kinase [Vicinamibacterales bacterium]|nr:NAD(+)/NADH kinase [Vicinamibacterales bacterium]